jgi:hypothetical protein
VNKLRAELDATPPDPPALADLLERLPIFARRLGEFPKAELWRLFDIPDLTATYDLWVPEIRLWVLGCEFV